MEPQANAVALLRGKRPLNVMSMDYRRSTAAEQAPALPQRRTPIPAAHLLPRGACAPWSGTALRVTGSLHERGRDATAC